MRFVAAIILALVALTVSAEAQVNTPALKIIPKSAAYSAGNCLLGNGVTGALQVTGSVTSQGDGGTLLTDITVIDSSGQDANIDFLVFEQQPTGTYTDGSACSLATADLPFVLGPFKITSYTTYGTPGVGRVGGLAASINILPPGSAAPALRGFWVVPVVQGTPTYGSSQTLNIQFGVLVDQPTH